ncbi:MULTISPECIES: hypothetical protein [unclassified Gilliamella]|uniref:hypothetical protein n=1 Tax=unclassified Gilliamella TaxID=2685620 RepID=UPI00226AD881|nr:MULTISPECIES: hypothetical protein [unclassified Gilliamella]MCX8655295.1 hypothetical protein [Gilliamella sp. B2894]MCX8664778.1 hypothetical protein [Gilliamella sp. B2887]MCX8694389.1 hypothetical protein [Gilliamella sp. B2881]MCX8695983.1 hypothetical protein [Gilliamella sp. B2828]MCX8697373.1 hypothetical protein [Gilliamella sp. B3000]
MLKVLICTNHMASIGGSEIVALEVAESFKKNNYLVDIVANYIGSPIIEIAKNSDINLFTTDELPNPFNYDIVWSQHQVLPILVNHYIESFNSKTFFVFAHLSPYEHLESFGLYTERLLANKILFNSEETYNHFSKFGIPTNLCEVFYNAAPSEFFCEKDSNNEQLKNILLVSNHPPQEMLDALEILKNEHGLNIINIGVRGNVVRLTSKMVEEADAIITIGKTVQYAIVSNTPVYCYDHFGGVGWILLENYKIAEQFNYSGRCCLRRISSSEIVEEIITYFPKAKCDVSKIKSETLDKYSLDKYIRTIIINSKENILRKTLNLGERQKIRLESEIVKSIKQYYNAYNSLLLEHKQLLYNNNELIIKNAELQSQKSVMCSKVDDQNLKHQELLTKYEELLATHQELLSKYQEFSTKIHDLSNNYEELSIKHQKISDTNKVLIEQKESISNKLSQLLEDYNNQLSKNQLILDNYNLLLNSYNKLETRYYKYKNTFFKRLARKIKRLYNKNVD